MKGIFIVAISIAILGMWVFVLNQDTSEPAPVGESDSTDTVDTIDTQVGTSSEETTDDRAGETAHELINVATPQPGATVESPIQLSGEARGTWFFEATAPVTVTNWDGLILGDGYIEAQGDWMTEEFVPFEGEITYQQQPQSYSATGTLIFQKANPSGLPEHADAFEMWVQLEDNSQ